MKTNTLKNGIRRAITVIKGQIAHTEKQIAEARSEYKKSQRDLDRDDNKYWYNDGKLDGLRCCRVKLMCNLKILEDLVI